MQQLENRSFDTRFGERCPFCNTSWGDNRPCGDSRADWTIRDGLSMLFSDRTSNCEICDRALPSNKKFCETCSQSRERERNKGDRHRMIKAECLMCGGQYERRSDKNHQRYCSLSCGNKGRTK